MTPTPAVPSATPEPASAASAMPQITPGTAEDSSATVVKSGTCGNSCKWTLDESGLLTVSGSGEMYDFTHDTLPWFDERTSITKIVVQNGVTRIGDYAFWGSVNAKTIVIPGSVSKIGENAFGARWHLEKFEVSLNSRSFCTIDGVLFSHDKTRLICYPNGRTASQYHVPDTVTVIEDHAFSYTDLSAVTLTPAVKTIDRYAFFMCKNLSSFSVPHGVKEINDYAFAQCTNMKRIELPQSITSIGIAFEGCSSSMNIYYEGSEQEWESIKFSASGLTNNFSNTFTVRYKSWIS